MNLRKSIIGTIGATLLIASTFAAAAADPNQDGATATVNITAGTLSVSIADFSLGTHPFSLSTTNVSANVIITATDMRGTHTGWTVSNSMGDFTAGAGGATMPKTLLTSNAYPTVASAQPGSQLWEGSFPGTTFSDGKWVGEAGHSTGSYDASETLMMQIPARQASGTYTSVITLTITSNDTP